MRRGLLLLAVGVLLGADRTAGGSVVVLDEALPSTLNPLYARSMADVRAQELIFDRLFFRSPIMSEPGSRLLERVTRIDDGRAVSLVLKEGLTWHDGEPFGPEDVCFTVNVLLDPRNPLPLNPWKEVLSSCEADSKKREAVLRFTRPLASPRDFLGFAILPRHVFLSTHIPPDDPFGFRPVGTGPLKGLLSRGQARFEAVRSSQHDAKIPALVIREVGTPAEDTRRLIAGEVAGIVAVDPAQRAILAATPGITLKSYDLRSWWFVAVNTHRETLGDVRVRRALDLSLDRARLRDVILAPDPADENPILEFVSGPFVQSSPCYNRQIKVHERADPAAARALLEEAGLVRVGGVWMRDGTPVHLRIGMHGGLREEMPDLLDQVSRQLSGAGFEVEVRLIPADDWSRKAVTGQLGDFDLLISKWSFGLNEDVGPLFYSRNKENTRGQLNIFNYSDASVDGILDEFEGAKTETEARDACHELHAYLANDLPYLFLWKLDTKSAWRDEVRNNNINPYYYFTMFDGWTSAERVTPPPGL